MSIQKIGWIGLGNMGNPMVKNLVKAGFEVTVYNRTKAKAEALQKEVNIEVANSITELLIDSDAIITMLTDDNALTEVYTGDQGILANLTDKKFLAIDMSTVSPETTKKLSRSAADKGISYIDAPVSGSVKPAEDAQLIIMAGGEKADFEAAQPIFGALGKLSLHLGANGAGNNAKLAINLFLAITIQGLSEALVFAQDNGIDPTKFLDIVNNGAVGSGITKIKSPMILNDDFKAAFALKLLAKDLRLAAAAGMKHPAGIAVAESFDQAETAGLGDLDMMAIIKHLGYQN
ncbi:NAD(P)-dependent oxidoreductase [Mucilaginibacter myungsuensis]|uniref:NAD(P)-dependent oxidoreductase n=1 Tax=Mucilaginibacter myungsuensis TaxID=649104 RepID=A0A929L2P5_9SPHI|nr:NAD(P)-dependent oxidoreductase [Mucilaginibacter myungsuensis]MBE9663374.1 NAD(P)-dependent oxidoreductase [Mucilaginibacter myungsuensis]MDN3600111.1 NAD(P)-dependent oxidoreductase [Mucilaginibacter myungsuensis]